MRRDLRVGEFTITPMIAAFVYKATRFSKRAPVSEETRAVQVDIGKVQPHRAALSYALGIVKVGARTSRVTTHHAEPRAREEAAWDKVLLAGSTEPVHCCRELLPRCNE